MIKQLAYSTGFGQRHWETRGVSPFLKGLDLASDLNLHRSAVTLDGIRDDILKFSNSNSFHTDYDFKLALSLTQRRFALSRQVPMLHLNDIFDYDLPIWSSSPGLPWREMGYKTKKSVIDDHENRKNIRWYWHRIKDDLPVYQNDCLAFVRSHLAEPGKTKVRAVWGYPMTITLGEAVFAIPLIEAYRDEVDPPIAYGYETAIGGMKRLRSEAINHKWFTSVDFKDFDKTVHADLIDHAFDILEYNIDFSTYRDYGVADARRNHKMWNFIRNYFINTPIRMCNGERYLKHSGVASGSYFTQLIDSVVNCLLLTWAFIKQHGRGPMYSKFLGDDGFIADDCPLDFDSLQNLVQPFGMQINFEKSMSTKNIDDVKFLGFKINYGAPFKEHSDWLAALLLPENPDMGWSDVASRALGLLHANCGVDSKFDFICRKIVMLQSFDLQLSRSMVRMLRIMGLKYIDKEPPDSWYFMRRLRLL